jgi:hypothetical protein
MSKQSCHVRPSLARGGTEIPHGLKIDIINFNFFKIIMVGRRRLNPPMNPMWTTPSTMPLKVKNAGPLSNFAFNFNGSRYIMVRRVFLHVTIFPPGIEVGWCRLTL